MSKKPLKKLISKWSIEDKPVKIDKWDNTAVKNSLDDMVKKIISEKYEMEESFSIVDGRLVICTIACIVSLFALVYDYIQPFPKSRTVLIICSLSYFFMMAVFTLYIKYVEKDIIFVGLRKDESGFDKPQKWTIRTNLKRFDDIYEIIYEFIDPNTNKRCNSMLNKSVASWINENGVILPKLLEKDLTYLHDKIITDKKLN
ncbi:signal peptidase complex subunit 2-like [Gordionus sp. m RMFG-2023]|uniref:signal peptidase complex subunit 2-like n=1 Tax=Gordionus sp. m RMFG-2023 TaxID=3053472 RepID=UPI0031FCAC05